jgi:hypothetical protein
MHYQECLQYLMLKVLPFMHIFQHFIHWPGYPARITTIQGVEHCHRYYRTISGKIKPQKSA